MAFIKRCFSRGRGRNQSNSVSQSLLADEPFSDSKRAEPSINSSPNTKIIIKDIPTHFKVAQSNLNAAVHSIEQHIRHKQIYGKHLPVSFLMVGLAWMIHRIVSIQLKMDKYESELGIQQNLYQTTWVNYSYPMPRNGSIYMYPEEPQPWLRAYENSTCKQASYPQNITFPESNFWIYRRAHIIIPMDCGYYSKRTFVDFRSTIGFALCEYILDRLCSAAKELYHAENVDEMSYLGVSIALISLAIACIYYYSFTTLCIQMNTSRAKSIYDTTKYYGIVPILEEDFHMCLQFQPKELLKFYKQGIDNYLNNYQARSAFIYGIKWHHSSTLKTLVNDPLYDSNILKFILEFAGMDNGHFHTKLIKPAAASIENGPSSIPERTTESSALNIYRFLGGTPPNIQLEEETTPEPSI